MNHQFKPGDWVQCVNVDAEFCNSTILEVGDIFQITEVSVLGNIRGSRTKNNEIVDDPYLFWINPVCFIPVDPFQIKVKQIKDELDKSLQAR
ncbi:hypothetical protein CLV58_11929 [Spirosoma oryzae]|uniref:Uncharacterized protein n=1 Tax=Spirosoma oryzae TaxID=1469603 RepID=A0A2T0SKE9_9BACT|nr:hypothetical protein [Spirosoma oryzae]PRY33880.1 hypothetical protein CLV58_11929 [Spirosoma oryzae]